MRQFILATVCALAPLAAARAGDLSAEIGRTGLAATEARLAALGAPSEAERFALGGVRFLGAVEGALQLRWRSGLTEELRMLPFLRLPIEENPAPAPFDPASIARLFRDVAAAMHSARAPLDPIGEGSDFGLEIALSDLWFDINANARRDAGEDLLDVAGPMILGWQWAGRDPAAPAPVIRFDAADAAWLSAYAHMLAGFSEVILAYDPTEAITRTLGAKAAIEALRASPAGAGPYAGLTDMVDTVAILLGALNQTPDSARAASAQGHFLAMIAENRRFWARVAQETDNDREWLPNDAQQSALGIAVPAGTGAVWQGVLADAEALLTGQALAPYWRLDTGAGINVGALFTRPAPIDLIGWIQGADALPYMERGRVVSGAGWRAFEAMVAGEAMLFTLWLN